MTLRNQSRQAEGTGRKSSVGRRKVVNAFLKEQGFKTLFDYVCHAVKTTPPDYDECMLWQFGSRDDGYGVVMHNKKPLSVHRLALELKLGHTLSSTLQACHKCDTPKCFNPNHLFPGSRSDNMRDMAGKFRGGSFERISQTKRNAIRDLYVSGFNRSAISEMLDVSTAAVYDITKDINIKAIAQLQRKYEQQSQTGTYQASD